MRKFICLMMVVLGVLLGGAHAYGTSWKDYPYGTPSIADTFLFGDYSNKTNKQITAPDLAKYVVSLKLPDITESNGLVTLTAPILGTSAGFSSLTLNTLDNRYTLNINGSIGSTNTLNLYGNGFLLTDTTDDKGGGTISFALSSNPNQATILSLNGSSGNPNVKYIGGDVNITGGEGEYAGGQVKITGGKTDSGSGGDVIINGGSGSGEPFYMGNVRVLATKFTFNGSQVTTNQQILTYPDGNPMMDSGNNLLDDAGNKIADPSGNRYDGSGQLPASTSIALNTDPKIVLAKTNITVTTSGPITAGVVQTANGAIISLTNTFIQNVFTNGTVSYVDPNGNDSIARRGVRDYPYSTLTNAIAGASNGDTIMLLPGSYVSSSAKISKQITINGSGVLNTTITFSTNNSVGAIAGFILNSANISLKNMTIKMQPQASGYVDAPIYIGTDSSGVPAFGFNSVVATNLWLENLDLNGYSDVVYFYSSGSVNGNAKNVRFSSSFDTFNFYSQSATYFNFQNCEFNAIAGTPITNNMCRALVANGAVTYTVTHSKFNIQNGTSKNTVFCVNSQFSGTPPTFYSFDNAFFLSSTFTTSYINDSASSAVTPSLTTDLSVSPSLVKTSGYNVTFNSDGRYQLLSSVITNYVSVLNSTNGYFTYVTNANGTIVATYIATNTPTSSLNGAIPVTTITGLMTNYVNALNSTNGYFTYVTNANGTIVATYVATNVPTSIIKGIFTNVVIFSPPPTSSISTGIMGSLIYSTNYLYLCVSNNSWLRCPMYSF